VSVSIQHRARLSWSPTLLQNNVELIIILYLGGGIGNSGPNVPILYRLFESNTLLSLFFFGFFPPAANACAFLLSKSCSLKTSHPRSNTFPIAFRASSSNSNDDNWRFVNRELLPRPDRAPEREPNPNDDKSEEPRKPLRSDSESGQAKDAELEKLFRRQMSGIVNFCD
jgi:hypothetical protein